MLQLAVHCLPPLLPPPHQPATRWSTTCRCNLAAFLQLSSRFWHPILSVNYPVDCVCETGGSYCCTTVWKYGAAHSLRSNVAAAPTTPAVLEAAGTLPVPPPAHPSPHCLSRKYNVTPFSKQNTLALSWMTYLPRGASRP